MERIMLVLNALTLNEHSVKFACKLSELTGSSLTGLFLENIVEDERLTVKNAYDGTYITIEADRTSPAYIAKKTRIANNVEEFKRSCAARNINAAVLQDERKPAHEVLKESRFADLMIVDADMTFKKDRDTIPSLFLRKMMRSVACPVLVVPKDYEEDMHEIIFAYDGTASSVFAMRQFTYLFPEWSGRKLIVLNASDREEADISIPLQMREWLAAHYTSFLYEELHGKRLGILLDYLLPKKNAIVVMGAYGRGGVSRLLRESSADVLLNKTGLPLFIAHR